MGFGVVCYLPDKIMGLCFAERPLLLPLQVCSCSYPAVHNVILFGYLVLAVGDVGLARVDA